MAKQVKIKDIAKMAGVSAGTVDRILHNRGNVSQASKEAVERVLSEVGYKYNIHTSAISLRKEYKIVISIPTASIGEYWGSIQTGFEHALEEYCDVRITCRYAFYNQFDIYSCRSAFSSIIEEQPDAVIIGPTFADETAELCQSLEKAHIPYVFVDSKIENTKPLATFTTDQYACGRLLGRMLHAMTPEGCSYAIFSTQRIGNQRSNNSLERRKGFIEYLESTSPGAIVKETSFSMSDPDSNQQTLMDFLNANKDVKGIAVMNSRGYIVSDLLQANGIDDVKLASFDLTYNNCRCLKSGYISTLLCQRPELQGFHAIKVIIRHLLYKQNEEQVHHTMPIDIIMKENLPFYKEFFGI